MARLTLSPILSRRVNITRATRTQASLELIQNAMNRNDSILKLVPAKQTVYERSRRMAEHRSIEILTQNPTHCDPIVDIQCFSYLIVILLARQITGSSKKSDTKNNLSLARDGERKEQEPLFHMNASCTHARAQR